MAEAAVAKLVALGVKAIYAKIAVAAAKVVITAAVSHALSRQSTPEVQGQLINLALSSDEPRRLPIGRRLTGGLLVDWYVRGSKNQNLYFVIYLGEGPCGLLKTLYAGGREVYSGSMAHGVRTTIPDFRSGGDRLWVTYYDGRPGQTADANLVSQGLGWTSAHKGTGMAYAIVEMQWDSDNMVSPPSLSFEMEGAKLYDRRLDSTAGGSGAHRYDNPATWAYSTNPAVALDHYLLGRISNGVKTFGIGLDAADVSYARFAALANLCDEAVTLRLGGSQNRYEANGFLFADRSFKDTIFDLARSMNARAADFGGRLGILDGQPRTPVMTLDESDLAEGIPDVYRPKRSWSELVSGVEGRFQDPTQSYQPVDYPRVVDAAWAAEDGGDPKLATLDLEMEVSAERAQRLAWLYVMRERRQAQLTGTYPLKAIELEQGDWFIRTGGKFGAGKIFEVMNRTLDPVNFFVTINAFEVDATDSAWDETGAAPDPDAPIPDVTPSPAIAVPTITILALSLSSGGVTFPAVRFTNPNAGDDIPETIEIQVAIDGGGGVPSGEYFGHFIPAGAANSTMYGLFPGQPYVARFRASRSPSVSAWSSWQAFTTTAQYTGGDAVSVPWSGVTGIGRPDDDADVTSLSIALGIIGQGWGATAPQSDIDNSILQESFARSNILPIKQQKFNEGDGDNLYIVYGEAVGTGVKNPYTGLDALKIRQSTTDKTGVYIHFYAPGAAANLRLSPGKYGVKLAGHFDNGYNRVNAYLRHPDHSTAAALTHNLDAGELNEDITINWVLDLSAETDISDYYLEFFAGMPGVNQYEAFWLHKVQLVALPDDATHPGAWDLESSTIDPALLNSHVFSGLTASPNTVIKPIDSTDTISSTVTPYGGFGHTATWEMLGDGTGITVVPSGSNSLKGIFTRGTGTTTLSGTARCTVTDSVGNKQTIDVQASMKSQSF